MWEKIPEPEITDLYANVISQRLKVPGGWLIRTMSSRADHAHVAQTFIADREHTWQLEK